VETGSSDIRAIVVGDKVVASMQRIAVQGEKRANIHAGAIGEACVLDAHTKRLAVDAAKAMGAEICGVDMLSSIKGPVVIELNLSPGLQGIKKATGIDVAEHIAKHLYRQAEKQKNGESASPSDILKEIGMDEGPKDAREIIANMDLRGTRLLLPEVATRLSGFHDKTEVIIKFEKDKLTIEKA